jgi:2-keto-4-pentenoate hydratase
MEQLAAELRDAALTLRPVAALTARHPGLTPQDAYRIQQINLQHHLSVGRKVRGHKVGLTSEAMQRQLKVDEPDFGILLDDMIVQSGETVSVGTLVSPRIEAEIAVTLGSELRGPGVTYEDAAGAVASVVPTLEIIDSRIDKWAIALADTIADNASSALAVIGQPVRDMPVTGLVNEQVELLVDGEVVAEGTGANLLGDPILCLVWLANRIAEFDEHLPAGTLILAGSVHASVPFEAGREYVARYSRAGQVTVLATD